MRRRIEIGEKFMTEDGYCEITADRGDGVYMCDHYIDECDADGLVISQRKDINPVLYHSNDISNNIRIYGKF